MRSDTFAMLKAEGVEQPQLSRKPEPRLVPSCCLDSEFGYRTEVDGNSLHSWSAKIQ